MSKVLAKLDMGKINASYALSKEITREWYKKWQPDKVRLFTTFDVNQKGFHRFKDSLTEEIILSHWLDIIMEKPDESTSDS